MCQTNIVLCVALAYVLPWLGPMWHLWLRVPGTKCNIRELWRLLPCVISFLNHRHCASVHSWWTEGNVTWKYYKDCYPALMVSSIPATVAAFIPGATNEMCHTPIVLGVVSRMRIRDYWQCSIFDSSCNERNITLWKYKASCPTLSASSIRATVTAFIPGARNHMCQTRILLCVARSDVYHWLLPMGHISFLVPGTQCAIPRCSNVLLLRICNYKYCQCDSIDFWCQ